MNRVRWRAWIPIGLYVATVLVVSATFVPTTLGVSDKLLHAAEFAGLALLIVRGIAIQFGCHKPGGILVAAWLLTISIGATDELTQSFAPLRTSDFADLQADALGALLGVLIGGWLIVFPARDAYERSRFDQ